MAINISAEPDPTHPKSTQNLKEPNLIPVTKKPTRIIPNRIPL